ncbi:serine/threonine-protein kinase Smg1 isoform X2 [Glossina fuscipes]|uniref:non-specific serine/threonine protein kinase n=1 Tax=Glossina fuscipes TaxID=7396 RepID=A0A9C5YZR8_9MUSC|nr:serine/threonine-protein kinase Smg1 isoform X2 [Glossina fuscipes]
MDMNDGYPYEKKSENNSNSSCENLLVSDANAYKQQDSRMWLINGMDRPERKSALSQDDCENQQAIGDTCHSQQHFKANISELREYVEGAQLVVKKDIFTIQENPEGMSNSNHKYPAKQLNHLSLLSENLRISKILRRLLAEDNGKIALELCKKLDTAVRSQSNSVYICRSFDYLFENMINVLNKSPFECLEVASGILGVMGYINRTDYAIYKMHLTKAYMNHPKIRKYLMLALKTTISCDAVNLSLVTYSEGLLSLLKEYLENSEAGENFIAVSDTIGEFSKHYKIAFQTHFTDIVDIIIGWHLEIEQSSELKRHCAKVLQQFAPYFLSELNFTYGLLVQFIEDIDVCCEEILSTDCSAKVKQEAECRLGAFIGAFTSIIKALISKNHDFSTYSNAQTILNNALTAISKAGQHISNGVVIVSEATTLNLNEFYCLFILNQSMQLITVAAVEDLLEMQLKILPQCNINQQCSVLYLILTTVKQFKTQLPLSFVNLIMKTTCNPVQELKLSCDSKAYKLLLKIYHDILMIKNVPLLQKAYHHITADVNDIIAHLANGKNLNISGRAETLLNFYVAALAILGTQTSSIIGMYALNPSILELLIHNCRAADQHLWSQYPALHEALLQLIIVHCSKNHNFRQTSRLLTQQQDISSPTSENFVMILKFLANIFQWYESPAIIKWLGQILEECQPQHKVLIHHINFRELCEAIIAFSQNKPMMYSRFFFIILHYPKLPQDLLLNIRDIALCLLDAADINVSRIYCSILGKLPLEICLQPNKDGQFFSLYKNEITSLLQWQKTTQCFFALRPKYFKSIMESMEPMNINSNIVAYQKYFDRTSSGQHRQNFAEYAQNIAQHSALLCQHLQYECARHCVQQKLRTSLGKPQETFLAIEGIVMKFARLLAEKESLPANLKNPNDIIEIQKNARMLLGFLENLEKHIYNAGEGTAYAMLPVEKPAKTFFRVNATTCREWFKRIRTAVNLIALHSLEPEMVIRYSENILRAENSVTNPALLDRTVTSMVWALLNCGEADSLQGLFVWLKAKNGDRFNWIQHAVEQATGHLEQAANGYTKILRKDNLKNMDNFVKEFFQRQLAECLYNTARWSEILNISDDNISYTRSHLHLIESIYENSPYNTKQENINQAWMELTEWPICNNEGSNIKSVYSKPHSYSYDDTLLKLKDACIHEATSGGDQNSVVETLQIIVQKTLREAVMHGCEPAKQNQQFMEFLIINSVVEKLLLSERKELALNKENFLSNTSSYLTTKQLLWSLIIAQRQEGLVNNSGLFLKAAISARREGNTSYCQSLLERFFSLKGLGTDLSTIAEELKTAKLKVNCNDTELLNGFNELSKYSYAQSNSLADALELEAACCSQIIEQNSENFLQQNAAMCCEIFLTMADWLNTQRISTPSSPNYGQFQRLLNQLPDISICTDKTTQLSLPSQDHAVGKLLHASVLTKSDCGDAWFSYGNWCYRWGKKIMEARNLEQASDPKASKLSKHDISLITEQLDDKIPDNPEVVEQVINILNSHMLNTMNDGGVEDSDNNATSASDILESELQKIKLLSSEQVSVILLIWRNAHKGMYRFYEEATRAYFKYLAIESEKNSTYSKRPTSEESIIEDCTFVTTTLRILRLIVKHAAGLQDVLEEGLSNTPLRPWKVIVPQLFSRLNHHEPYVRRSVSDLLCRLSIHQPQLIIFPAVVGAQQELNHRESNQVTLSNCFGTLLHMLSEQAPETVLHVQLLVKELRRITFLWEEYWMHSLTQFYAEYSPLYNALEAETKKTNANTKETILFKYEIFMKHLLSDFQQITTVTDKEPETNYERSFQERFKPHISAVLAELQKSLTLQKPNDCWTKIKQLYTIFQQRPLRGNNSNMKVSDISPVLSNMQNTGITMPGLDIYEQPAVYIKSVDSLAYILPTKTKPKKLSFYGSNGHRYTFLFKGQEDLHLDERIMQFLSISNSMMARSHEIWTKTDSFKAHHYNVIPLGNQSGLISWVDGLTPLFAIYKKWQQRDALLKQQQNDRQGGVSGQAIQESSMVINASRPSELYFNKLEPLLAEHKLKVTDPRKQWPIQVLRSALRQLTKETPRDLLSKEIWCQSTTAVEWRKAIRHYSISLAVMSIIGYVIGLGDRHLDNVLIKLSTGEIVHIDYNVCFEKGKTLRIPEKVPFRLTPNLVDALGLTGTEGAFRLSCEYVLKTLRRERETLLTLLEAFVYDPLVDWTVNDDGTTTVSRVTSAHVAAASITALDNSSNVAIKDLSRFSAKDMYQKRKQDVDLSRQAIIVRCQETQPLWLKYKENLDMQLNALLNLAELFKENRRNVSLLEHERDSFIKQQAMVRELEALGTAKASHALNTVTQRYNTYKKNLTSFQDLRASLKQTFKNLEIYVTTYFEVLLNPEELEKVGMKPLLTGDDAVILEYLDHLKQIRHTSEWQELCGKIEYSKDEMYTAIQQAEITVKECQSILLQYSRIMQYIPREYFRNNHLMRYKKLYEKLISNQMPADECLLDTATFNNSNETYVRLYFEKLQNVCQDLNDTKLLCSKTLQKRDLKQDDLRLLARKSLEKHDKLLDETPEQNERLLKLSIVKTMSSAYKAFSSNIDTRIATRNHLTVDYHLNFVEMIDEFVNILSETLHDSDNYEIVRTLVICLKQMVQLKDNLNCLPEKILSLLTTDNKFDLECILADKTFTRLLRLWSVHNGFNVVINSINEIVESLGKSMQSLQINMLKAMNSLENLNDDELLAICHLDINSFLMTLCNNLFVKLFTTMKSHVDSMRTSESSTPLNVYNARLIYDSINDSILDFESTCLLKLSQCCFQTICHKIQNEFKSLSDTKEDFVHTDYICQWLHEALQANYTYRYDKKTLLYESQLMEHQQLVTNAFYWAHESILNEFITPDHHLLLTKPDLIDVLRLLNKLLVARQSTAAKIQSELDIDKRFFVQKLQNQELVTANEYFDALKARCIFYINLLEQLTLYCNILLQFEMAPGDNLYITAMREFEQVHQRLRASEIAITPVERSLVQLLDPEDAIDQYWIENVSALLEEMIFTVQKKICSLEKKKETIEKNLVTQGQQLQYLLNSSVRLDLRQLLKMFTKSFKQSTSKLDSTTELRDLQHAIKLLQTKLNDLQLYVGTQEFDEQSLDQIVEKVKELQCLGQQNNDKLLLMIENFLNTDCNRVDLSNNQCINLSPNRQMENSASSQISEQKRNAYAVSVWKRIRMKLDGRDPDPNRRSTVNEQVDFVIREAISEDNLASLYEGWTPWV